MNANIIRTFPFRHRRAVAVAALALAGAVATSLAITGGEALLKKPPVVKLDSTPVDRAALEPASYAKVAKAVSPSVVKIVTEIKARTITMTPGQGYGLDNPFFRQFFGGELPQMRQAPEVGLGSGVIISSDGYIVTNNHVVKGADRVTVTLNDGRELHAKIIGRDPQTDLAVIKVDASDLPAITFAESSKAEVGDRVLAIGNPFGIGETVTSGIISAKGRRPGLGLAYEDFLQTDAAINPGNSGGALVDVQGRLVGINTAILTRSGGFQGVGLAIPSDLVRSVVDSIVQHGKVIRGFLGVTIQNLTPSLAESFELKSTTTGAIVTDVRPGGPADKAGLQSGDVIVEMNGRKIKESSDISLKVAQMAPDSKVSLKVERNGKPMTINATVGKMPADYGEIMARANGSSDDNSGALSNNDQGVLNGVAVADLDPATRRELNVPFRIRGAVITDVAQDSASARAGLKPGDIILEINHHPVHDADEAVKLTEHATTKKTLVKLWSRGGIIYAVVDESGTPSP